MIYFSDSAIIQGIRLKKESVIRHLYREYFPCILSMVQQNKGIYEDAEDVFQDGMMILYKKCSEGDVSLSCSLKTYFYSICRNIWLQRLERTRKMEYRDPVEVNERSLMYNVRDQELKEDYLERLRYFQNHFLSLPNDCQQILLMFFDKVPLKEIAEKMRLSGVKYVKSRKYVCKNMLRKKILNDPACLSYIINDGTRKDQ